MKGVAAVLVGVAIALYVSQTVMTNLNLTTGLYATVTGTIFPLIALGVAVAILLNFLGGR